MKGLLAQWEKDGAEAFEDPPGSWVKATEKGESDEGGAPILYPRCIGPDGWLIKALPSGAVAV